MLRLLVYKNLHWPVIGQSRAKQGKLNLILEERRRICREAMKPLPGTYIVNLVGKPQPHGDTQINRNGLN